MTNSQRDQLATPVVLVYWLMLVGGLLVYGMTQIDDNASFASFAALWAGAVGGTLLGQCLALRDYRLWIAALVIAGIVAFGAPLVPRLLAGPMLWRAFVPAALCGFWSLGDRSALPAFWFPSVIWMLSILDRSDATRAPDSTGVALLGALAVLFLVFLRARESRRVGLWRSVGPHSIAPVQPPELLREPPGRQLARAGWGLTVTAITIAITAWIAPTLWQRERLPDRRPVRTAHRSVPCCPVYDADLERLRVKEYLDLGHGHDARIVRSRDGECRICPGISRGETRISYEWGSTTSGVQSPTGPRHVTTPRITAPAQAPVRSPVRSIESDVPVTAIEDVPGVSLPRTEIVAPVTGRAPIAVPTTPAPPPSPPVPIIHSRPTPLPVPPQQRALPAAPRATSAAPETADAYAPEPAPRRAASWGVGPSILRWLVWLGVAALVFQLVSLVLRPLRRLFTLRHLRRPFWDETVAQQVSNAWQLALVGLRDAGWRPGASEAPQELARRVGVDGLERCATILERARHGIGIDADDLSAMSTSADAAYHAARSGLGSTARALGWLRWPLT
jgi:hypothetical protein